MSKLETKKYIDTNKYVWIKKYFMCLSQEKGMVKIRDYKKYIWIKWNIILF